jgi:hypothetical protein
MNYFCDGFKSNSRSFCVIFWTAEMKKWQFLELMVEEASGMPVDLKKTFGHKYEISLDPSWEAETPENRAEFLVKSEEIFYYEIRGRCGMVYAYSWTEINVILLTRAALRLVKLMGPELMLLQHADQEMCYKADAKHAATFVRFIKPKRLQPFTEEHKTALSARLAAHRQKRWPKSGVGWLESEATVALSHSAPILPTHSHTKS